MVERINMNAKKQASYKRQYRGKVKPSNTGLHRFHSFIISRANDLFNHFSYQYKLNGNGCDLNDYVIKYINSQPHPYGRMGCIKND